MNIVIWMLAGGILGWIGYSFLDYNGERGMKVSIIIGIVGGFFGGMVIAPVFIKVGAVAGDFSTPALAVAVAAAAGFLFVGEQLLKRWGV